METTKSLKDKCPICGNNLYAYNHTPASDNEGLASWYVECNSDDCDYEYFEQFVNISEVLERFDAS